MRIPDLPPDIRFRRMHADDEAAALVIKKAALGPHIAARWGWDDVETGRSGVHAFMGREPGASG